MEAKVGAAGGRGIAVGVGRGVTVGAAVGNGVAVGAGVVGCGVASDTDVRAQVIIRSPRPQDSARGE